MVLVLCRECKASISDQASSCPHCGYPLKEQPIKENIVASSIDSQPPNGRKNGRQVWAWVIGIAIFTPIVIFAGIYMQNKLIGPVGWAQDNTKKALKDMMKDPESMVIRSSFVVQKVNKIGINSIYVCGIVDGKNSFGAYSGGTRFASWSSYSKSLDTLNTISVQMEDSRQQQTAEKVGSLSVFDEVYWNEWCVDANHPVVVAKKDG